MSSPKLDKLYQEYLFEEQIKNPAQAGAWAGIEFVLQSVGRLGDLIALVKSASRRNDTVNLEDQIRTGI